MPRNEVSLAVRGEAGLPPGTAKLRPCPHIPIKNLSVSGTEVEFSYGEVWRGGESPLHDFKSQSYLPQPRTYPRRSHGQDNIGFWSSL